MITGIASGSSTDENTLPSPMPIPREASTMSRSTSVIPT